MSPELQKVFDFWVSNLRLRDWALSVKRGIAEKFGNDNGTVALVSFSSELREATVFLRRLDKLDQGLEEDLVHELLHLVFIQASHSMIGKPDNDQILLEQALNVTANTLVALRRRTL
jgi:hypothetical protein